jgi:hypothetical protein
LSAGTKKGTEGLIGPSLKQIKDIQNEYTCDNLDSFAQNNISSFSNTASYVVMPLQSPTNGAYDPISTACHGASSSGSAPYSAPYGTVGLPITPWGSSETHKQQGALSTNLCHSSGPETKGDRALQLSYCLLFHMIMSLAWYMDNYISFCRSSIYCPCKSLKAIDFLF